MVGVDPASAGAAGRDRAVAAGGRHPRRIGWWWAGHVLDIVHMPLVILLVILGAGVWPGEVYVTVVAAVVIAQVALLACPVMALSGWMKQRYDPSFENRWSATVWLYRTYGPATGIAVFLFFLTLALVVRALWF